MLYNDFDHINTSVIVNLKELGYRIKPYKENLVQEWTPRRLTSQNRTTLKKIFDVNDAMKSITRGIQPKIKAGLNIASLDRYLYRECAKRHMYPSTLGYGNFPKASCICINDVVCHGVPYEMNLKDGDVVTVDYCLYNGIHTDWAHTYCVGKVSGTHKRLVSTTEDCLRHAIDLCKPGRAIKEIGRVVTKIANENGFKVIEKYGGHGIGSQLHMEPRVPNSPNNITYVMKEGDMFSIEPLLAVDSGATYIAPDGLSVMSSLGTYAAHFERTLLITNDGCVVLNDS
jgi:methionyl aminopeptidase